MDRTSYGSNEHQQRFLLALPMAKDYYKILEIDRGASADEIQKAYRKLARKFHPDLNPDDASARQRFQEVQNAFDVLNDPKKRAQYDRFGDGFESSGGGGPFHGQGEAGPRPGFQDVNFEDLFGQQFGKEQATGGGFGDFFRHFTGGGHQAGAQPAARGADLLHEITVPFTTAIQGGEVQVTVQRRTGKREAISVKIPAGIEEGKKIRLRGQGEQGTAGGPPGDILIQVKVARHPFFQRRGNDLDVRVPITLAEAAVGAKVDIPTPQGTITLSVPPGTSSGTKLRARGHGLKISRKQAGDLLAEIQIVLPKNLDADDWIQIKKLDSKHPMDPRADLSW